MYLIDKDIRVINVGEDIFNKGFIRDKHTIHIVDNIVKDIGSLSLPKLRLLDRLLKYNSYTLNDILKEYINYYKVNNLLDLKDKDINKHNIMVLYKLVKSLDNIKPELIRDEEGLYSTIINDYIKEMRQTAKELKLEELYNNLKKKKKHKKLLT